MIDIAKNNAGKDRHHPDYMVGYTLYARAAMWDAFVETIPRGTRINDAINDMMKDKTCQKP